MFYLAMLVGLVAWGALVFSRREAEKYEEKVSGPELAGDGRLLISGLPRLAEKRTFR